MASMMVTDVSTTTSSQKGKVSSSGQLPQKQKITFRRIPVPAHRMTPLKNSWMDLYVPVTSRMNLLMRMNLVKKCVELKMPKVNVENSTSTSEGGKAKQAKPPPEPSALQKCADFVAAFLLGFEVRDALALLRLDDLYVERFEVKDVKTLRGEHMARCIGRLAGRNGATRFTLENATRTRIVVADTHIHILGSYANIRVARDAICSLILGSPPSKVFARLRAAAARLN